jgi:hypothetical protein
MQSLHLDPDVVAGLEDEWEVAGAGPPSGKPKGLKSGALIPAQHDVLTQYDYPHKHVLRGAGRSPPLAVDLTWWEFVFGYAEMMANPDLDHAERMHMIALLKLLMEDAGVRPWPQVRHLHMTIIQAMEAGQLQWGEQEAILAIQRQQCRAAAPVQPSAPRRAVSNTRTANGVVTPLYCAAYQTNTCEHTQDHDSPRGVVHHICAFCLRMTGRSITSHGESECRRKKQNDEPKN